MNRPLTIAAIILFAYVSGMFTYKLGVFPLSTYRNIVVALSDPPPASETFIDLAAPEVEISPEPEVEISPEEVDLSLYDFSSDPIGQVFYGQVRPALETALNRYVERRQYSTSNFPLAPDAHANFQEQLRHLFYENINTAQYRWDDSTNISENYTLRNLETVTIKGLEIRLGVLDIHETNDQVPIALCVPNNIVGPTPAVILFSGHTINSGLFDLLIDDDGYQGAMSRQLCEAGFITMTVEKIDSGYTSVRFQTLGQNNIIEREPGGGGDDELELATTLFNTGDHLIFSRQTMANLAAFDALMDFENVDLDRIGAAGVSFGGWQALHLALLRDEVAAISNFGGMWSYVEIHIDQNQIELFEGVPDFSQSFPGILLMGDQNRFVLGIAGREMQIGYGLQDYPYTEHAAYFYPVLRDQYEALGRGELLEEVRHEGGHEFPPSLVLNYFQMQFREQ